MRYQRTKDDREVSEVSVPVIDITDVSSWWHRVPACQGSWGHVIRNSLWKYPDQNVLRLTFYYFTPTLWCHQRPRVTPPLLTLDSPDWHLHTSALCLIWLMVPPPANSHRPILFLTPTKPQCFHVLCCSGTCSASLTSLAASRLIVPARPSICFIVRQKMLIPALSDGILVSDVHWLPSECGAGRVTLTNLPWQTGCEHPPPHTTPGWEQGGMYGFWEHPPIIWCHCS